MFAPNESALFPAVCDQQDMPQNSLYGRPRSLNRMNFEYWNGPPWDNGNVCVPNLDPLQSVSPANCEFFNYLMTQNQTMWTDKNEAKRMQGNYYSWRQNKWNWQDEQGMCDSQTVPKEGQTQLATKEKKCNFCRQNMESRNVYLGHSLKDSEGKVCCPILREYVCKYCGATGDNAHTRSYCPVYKNISGVKFQNATCLKKTELDSSGRKRRLPRK